jgi:ABC-2 type transport system ATP-binding protein
MSAELRIEAAELRRSFADRVAVGGLTVRIAAGEIYGLVGPDGAGKTTTLRMLAGLLPPDGGSVRLLGADPFGPGTAVREQLGYMPQQYSLYGDLTVDENLTFFGELFCLNRKVFRERRDRLLRMTRLDTFGSRRADALSGGMYKKLALACSLLHEPKVLLLDEPTNGVDPISRREFWDLLHDFLAEGMAIVIATPYMDEAARCDRTGLLFKGRILEEGRPGDLIRGLEHPVFRLEGDRTRLGALVEKREDILAFTPAGGSLRIVVRKRGEPQVIAAIQSAGGHAIPAVPSFEDLFLARARERRQP